MELAKTEPTHISRPLHILVPLIREDLKQAENASVPHFQAAGLKLLEAKGQLRHGAFSGWLKTNFKLSQSTASKYMEFAAATLDKQNPRTQGYSSLNAYHKATGHSAYVPNKPRPQPWHEPVKEAIGRVNIDLLLQESLRHKEERALQRKLSLSLIDIGYKALATKLHPDKGGSREAMTRLNRVRDFLRKAVTA